MAAPEPRLTVAAQLRQSHAHAGLTAAVEGFPAELAGRRVEGHAHTAWQLVEHMRLAAEDLIRYCDEPDYEETPFPEGYWPSTETPPSTQHWSGSVRQLLATTDRMARMIEDDEVDVYAPVAATHNPRHHPFRAALILLDHNGYHAAQLVALRQALGAWR